MNDLKDTDYKPDFEIADRYITFSSELLRLSLIALSGIGTVMLYLIKKETTIKFDSLDIFLFCFTILLFALTVASSLIHRFYATDCMSYHIAYLRTKEEKEKVGRKKCLKKSEKYLVLTEYLFGSSVFLFIISLFKFFICSTSV